MLETAADQTSRTSPARSDGVRSGSWSYDEGPGLREYLATLRRYWWLALLTFLAVLAASIASLYVIDPVYRAEAEILVRTEDSRQLFPRTSGTSAGALIRSPGAELVYVESDAFQQRAVEAAGDEAQVEVRGAADSSALVLVAEAGDPAAAQEAAQTWAETYVAARHESDVAETTALRDLLIGDRDALQTRQQEILQPVAALDEAVAVEADPVELSRLLNQRLAIQRTLAPELDPVETELRRVNTQISSLDVDLRVLEDPQALAYVSSAAEVPEERANGSMTQSVLVGVLAGLVLAGGAVAGARALRRP
ncbi:Wzz/FepE/Etk N-terminal domain-containing protein [Geodermatophilus ruber]|uniref:Chain length determinant protein n=1 Tax=Geodermatophilus ruber TaxID=504800 RepID=A0A1I4BSA7_9ACTN|nr:Wzz/FepE/Etk N-terminal domain-containing protein [Geodermatophilus ruber]SFK70889.1 Chain length determinant protein [Geodermatophilus ruber]